MVWLGERFFHLEARIAFIFLKLVLSFGFLLSYAFPYYYLLDLVFSCIVLCQGFHNLIQYLWAWSAIECYKRFVPPRPSPIGCWMDR